MHVVRIGHDDNGQVLLADDAGTGINIEVLRIERLLVPTVATPAQDEGTEVVATPTAFNFVGDGVVVTEVSGVATVTIPGGGGNTPTHSEQYLAGKATSAFVAADFTGTEGVAYATGEHTATMPTVTGNVFAAVARLATDPDPTFADVNGTGLNQFSDFTQQSGTVTLGGSAYNVWVSGLCSLRHGG